MKASGVIAAWSFTHSENARPKIALTNAKELAEVKSAIAGRNLGKGAYNDAGAARPDQNATRNAELVFIVGPNLAIRL